MGDMVMDDENKEIPESKITIVFSAPGSVVMTIDFKSVIPLQVAAAAWFLEKQAESGFFQQQVQQQEIAERQKIAVPTLGQRKAVIKP